MSAAPCFGASMADPSGHSRVAWSKSCGHCRRTYAAADWEGLPVVAAPSPVRVQAHLSVPAAWTVELRRCSCGSVLAVRSP